MMANEGGGQWDKAALELAGVGAIVMFYRDLHDTLDREHEPTVRRWLTWGGLLSPDGENLTERGGEAYRAALRLLAERQVSPARIEALAGGDVARWAALADAATPGPWEYDPAVSEPEALRSIKAPSSDGWCVAVDLNDDDGAFIAAARTAVPALCADNARLRAEVESLRAALAGRPVSLTPEEAAAQRAEPHHPDPEIDAEVRAELAEARAADAAAGIREGWHRGWVPAGGLFAEEAERQGHTAALVTLSAWTCITGRPEDAARAFAGLLGAAGESEDGRRGAARALLEGQPVPATTAEQDADALRRAAEQQPAINLYHRGYSDGMLYVLRELAPHLPPPRGAR